MRTMSVGLCSRVAYWYGYEPHTHWILPAQRVRYPKAPPPTPSIMCGAQCQLEVTAAHLSGASNKVERGSMGGYSIDGLRGAASRAVRQSSPTQMASERPHADVDLDLEASIAGVECLATRAKKGRWICHSWAPRGCSRGRRPTHGKRDRLRRAWTRTCSPGARMRLRCHRVAMPLYAILEY
jgi:hypothetical protein